MGALHSRSIATIKVLLLIVPWLVVAQIPDQNIRTSTFMPMPTVTLTPSDVEVVDPVADTNQPLRVGSSIQVPPLANTLLASIAVVVTSAASEIPSTFSFPSPLPSGVARTASGKPIPCSPKNTKLNPSTHKVISECTAQAFCLAPPGSPRNATGLGMCFPRLCRRDEFPFGYGDFGGGNNPPKIRVKGKLMNNVTAIVLPPMCSGGMFCPDDGSGCRQQVPIGGRCELGRDEQCATLPTGAGAPDAANKAICLHLTCRPATQGLNAPCTIENTTYVSDIAHGEAGGGQFTSFVIKHDCMAPSLFCDPAALHPDGSGPTCQRTRKLGQACTFDAQCELSNCGSANTCVMPPETPLRIAAWHWVATVLFILVGMSSIFLVLLFIHRKHRYARYQELQEYYHEQMSLRRAILALHTNAVDQYSEKPARDKNAKE